MERVVVLSQEGRVAEAAKGSLERAILEAATTAGAWAAAAAAGAWRSAWLAWCLIRLASLRAAARAFCRALRAFFLALATAAACAASKASWAATRAAASSSARAWSRSAHEGPQEREDGVGDPQGMWVGLAPQGHHRVWTLEHGWASQAPGWQVRAHRCPQVRIRPQMSLQEIPSEPGPTLAQETIVVEPQKQGDWTKTSQGGHSPGWHSASTCGCPQRRSWVQGREHWPQGVVPRSWHSSLHRWCPHPRRAPQTASQDQSGSEHFCIRCVWFPTHERDSGAPQGGHWSEAGTWVRYSAGSWTSLTKRTSESRRAAISARVALLSSARWSSHASRVAGWWQGAGQMWEHPSDSRSSPQGSVQGGQGPVWHPWGSLWSWWQEGGTVQGWAQSGGARTDDPQGYSATADPHAQETRVTFGQG